MVSLVVPVFNEEESLVSFYHEVIGAVSNITKAHEIIFVDDGSTDGSLAILKALAEKDKNIRIFSFRRNQGKAEALSFGFQKAKGEYIVTLDSDLQDKPQEIGKLLEKAKEGWDVVCGWRKNRRDPLRKVISSKLFNFLVRRFWGLNLHDYNCGLKLFKKEATDSLRLYGGMHRFIPILVHQEGFKVCEIAVVHESRKFGKSKYGFSKLWKDLPDIFTMLFLSRYSDRPLHLFGTVGSVFLFIGIGILVYLSIIHFQGHAIGRRPLLFFGMVFILGGFQIFFTGFLADLIINLSRNSHTNTPLLRYQTEE